MKAYALALPALSLLLLTAVAPPVAAWPPSDHRCATTIGSAVVNCGAASFTAWTDLARCEYGREVNPGIWEAYCPIILTVHVSATQWIGEGGWSVQWPGWCGSTDKSWPATNTGEVADTHTCQIWPYVAARCNFAPLTTDVYVHFRGQSIGGAASTPSPGTLALSADSARPQPPGGC